MGHSSLALSAIASTPSAPHPLCDSSSAKASNPGLLSTIEMGRRSIEMATQVAEALAKGSTVSPHRVQPISFRKLARMRLLPWGASSMWRAARIYELAQQYPELYRYQHLGVAHLAPMICLKDPLRLAVLRRAERRTWSRRQVEFRIKALLARHSESRSVSPSVPLHDYLLELGPLERNAARSAAAPVALLRHTQSGRIETLAPRSPSELPSHF